MRFLRGLLCLSLLCAPPLATVTASEEGETLRTVASRLQDITGWAETREVDSQELTRLKKSAQLLQFQRLQFYYRVPDQFRVDSRGRGLLKVSMVQSGDRKTFRTSLGLRRTRDLRGEPAKKQGPLDFGMLSSALWNDYRFHALGAETAEGMQCLVWKLTLIEDPEYGYHKLWLERKTLRIVRRDKYTREGDLKVRYRFKEPERAPVGLWYSRRIELYSPQDRLVGALALQDVRINEGLRDDLFR